MNDIAGEVVQQLQAMQADDDALLTLEIIAKCGAPLTHSDPYAALHCQHQRGQKTYVVTAPWTFLGWDGLSRKRDKELCFRADEAHAAIRYLILVAADEGIPSEIVNIYFSDKDTSYLTEARYLFNVNAQPGEKDIEAVSKLLPIIESARHLTDA